MDESEVHVLTGPMPLTGEARSNRLTLEAALARLRENDLVDGLALFGSRAIGSGDPVSDHDLLILVSSTPVAIFQMLTHIGGRMADVVFVLTDRADRLLAAPGPVAPNSSDGRFLLKMQTAQIVYDASGRLGRTRDLARRGGWRAPAAFADQYGAWFWQNFGLFQIRRMAQSDDPAYLTVVDLMLCAGLSDIGRAYCQIRNVPWEGEKAALRYWRAHDPAYLALLRECLAASDRSRKVQLYEQLVAETLGPAGPLWQPGATAVCLDAPDASPAKVEAALDFWESLFDSPQATR